MKYLKPLSVVIVAGLLLGWMPGTASAKPIRILPLGDSITQGGNGTREEYTYRLPLFRMLVDAKVDFDFIGSMTAGSSPDFKWPAYNGRPFDLHHEGHYGWKTAQVRDHLKEWMVKWGGAPDIVLIHLGTNDQNSDHEKMIIHPLTEIIGMLRKENPKVIVLVGHLNLNAGEALKIRAAVEAMAKKLNTAASPVITVPHYQQWIATYGKPDSDTFDGIHPSPAGQLKMAKNWFEAMKPYLKIKTP